MNRDVGGCVSSFIIVFYGFVSGKAICRLCGLLH